MRGILGGEEDREATSQGAGKLGKPRPYYIRDLSANRSIVGAPLAGALARYKQNLSANRSIVGARVAWLAPALVRGRPGFSRPAFSRWQTILFWLAVLALFAFAVSMRLYDLGLPFDRDTYDEGVYWQSLRAMSAGHPLYQQIFYSQPPFFLLSTFPSYVLFGGTLWSARFGIALVSLLGLLGIFVLGKALSGRAGGIVALLLLVVDPLYLAQSQTIQAEASAVAFSLLAVGLAYLWWEHPEGMWGICWAVLTGITLSLSILSKLLSAAAIVPIALLMLARLWQIWQRRGVGTRFIASGVGTGILPIVAGIGMCLLTALLVLLPFIGSQHALIQGVIAFHTDAATILTNSPQNSQQANTTIIEHALLSILTLAALFGTFAALLRRDWRVFPLLAWLLVTIFLLWHQVPLFAHHLVALPPPLIALAVLGIGRMPAFEGSWASLTKYTTWLSILAILLILVTAVLDVRQNRQYYRIAEANSLNGLAQHEAGQEAMRAAADLRQAITPDQLVVTDAQFVAALADRSTPPSLVDTSQVRIHTGYLTLQQLIDTASQAQVHAVLFFTGRFRLSEVATFHNWVALHFHLLHNYGNGMELWVR